MFGTRFGVVSRDGRQTAPVFAHGVLFGAGVMRDFSRQHAEVPFNKGDLRKSGQARHPLEREDQLDRYAPTGPWLSKATKEARDYLRRHLPSGPAKDEISALLARERYYGIPAEQQENFFHDFVNWLQGNGKPADRTRSGLSAHVPAGHPNLLAELDPSVRAFIDAKVDRAAEFEAEVAKMKDRGWSVGPGGRPATLEDVFRYFKYVVRGAPMDPEDTWWMDDQPLEGPATATFRYQGVAHGNTPLPDGPTNKRSYERAGMETAELPNPDAKTLPVTEGDDESETSKNE